MTSLASVIIKEDHGVIIGSRSLLRFSAEPEIVAGDRFHQAHSSPPSFLVQCSSLDDFVAISAAAIARISPSTTSITSAPAAIDDHNDRSVILFDDSNPFGSHETLLLFLACE